MKPTWVDVFKTIGRRLLVERFLHIIGHSNIVGYNAEFADFVVVDRAGAPT